MHRRRAGGHAFLEGGELLGLRRRLLLRTRVRSGPSLGERRLLGADVASASWRLAITWSSAAVAWDCVDCNRLCSADKRLWAGRFSRSNGVRDVRRGHRPVLVGDDRLFSGTPNIDCRPPLSLSDM